MEQVKLSRNHAHKYLLYVFHSTEKPQVKMLEPSAMMIEEMLGLKSDHSPISSVLSSDNDLIQQVLIALEINAFLVFTLEKYTIG